MELKEMTVEQLEERKAAIIEELDAPEADLDALEEEVRAIKEELEARKSAEAKKAEIRSAVAAGAGEVTEEIKVEERKVPTMEEVRNSKEYIDAFAEYIKTNDPTECRALLSENATGGTIPVPDYVEQRVRTAWEREGIMSRVAKSYVKGNLKIGFEISGSDAVNHTEGGAAVAEEELVEGVVSLIPTSVKKWVSFSDEVLDLTGTYFIDYVYDELTYKIAQKAAKNVIDAIEACGTVSTTTCPRVPKVAQTVITLGTIAAGLAELADGATDPVLMMNKKTWGKFKAAQAAGNYGYDPFEGLPLVFNNNIKSFDAASTGDTYVIIGDLGEGAQANFPAGENIDIKYDDVTLMTSDLVRVLGRQFVAVGVVNQDMFVKITK